MSEVDNRLSLNELIVSEKLEARRRMASLALATYEAASDDFEAFIEHSFRPVEYGTPACLTASYGLWHIGVRSDPPYKYLHVINSTGRIATPLEVQGEFWGLKTVKSSEIRPLQSGQSIPDPDGYGNLNKCVSIRQYGERFSNILIAFKHIRGYVALDEMS